MDLVVEEVDSVEVAGDIEPGLCSVKKYSLVVLVRLTHVASDKIITPSTSCKRFAV